MPISSVAQSDILDTWRIRLNEATTQLNGLGLASAITLTGGDIDGVAIGASSASTSRFTTTVVTSTLDIRGATLLLDNNTISGDAIDGGAASVQSITITGTVSNNQHGATKEYVDNAVTTINDDAIAFAIALG